MISGNSVSNIIMADDKEATEAALRCTLVEITPNNPGGIGWTIGEDGKFIAPPVKEITETPTVETVDGTGEPVE